MSGDHPVRMLCELFEVSPSGYYRWKQHQPSARKRTDAEISDKIEASHRASRGAYGAPRILEDLKEAGVKTSKRRCARLMKERGLRGRKRHRRRPRTTDSRHQKPIAANLMAKRPHLTGPNQCWLTDITFIETGEGWLYLAAILDRWSRKIVGWACAPTLHATLVLAALQLALRHRRPPVGLIHHSDRGSQYVEETYIAALAAAGIVRSMSRAGNCFDNAAMESFWSSLKTETGLDRAVPLTRKIAELTVFDYIEAFYNPRRRHSSLGQISPVAFETKQLTNHINAA